MLDSFGAALRSLRERKGWSLQALAQRTSYVKSYLSQLETGGRAPTRDVAAACDAALGSSPLLAVLWEIERSDDMHRRALLTGSFAAVAGGLLATTDTTAALAATLDAGLRSAAGTDTDWDAVAADFTRRHVLNPGPELGHELAGQLAVAQHLVAAGNRDAARGAAQLALVYALWLGDADRVPTAHALYATSAVLADRSEHRQTMALVRSRAASRGLYEGWTAARAQTAIDEALAIDAGGAAGLEAYGAQVHLAALTGRTADAERAVAAMFDLAERLPDADGPSAYRRAVSFATYVASRCGTLRDAQVAYDVAARELAAVPLWLADATVYYARAQIAAGDVTGGAECALQAMRQLGATTRILGIGVRDALSVVPLQRRGDEVIGELAAYASPGPVPWESVGA